MALAEASIAAGSRSSGARADQPQERSPVGREDGSQLVVHPLVGHGAGGGVFRPEGSEAVLCGQVTDDGVRLPEIEAVVGDHGHQARRVSCQIVGLAGTAVEASHVVAHEGYLQFVQAPQHLLHVHGVGPAPDLDHRSPLSTLATPASLAGAALPVDARARAWWRGRSVINGRTLGFALRHCCLRTPASDYNGNAASPRSPSLAVPGSDLPGRGSGMMAAPQCART